MTLTAGTYAVFSTTEGKITVRLFESDAPITVKNFIELAEGGKEWTHPNTHKKSTDKLFDGTVFHRVIPDFMIQGGDPTGTGMGGPGYRFQDETNGSPHKFDTPGKLAMANSGPGTNGCQFFITVAATPWLTGNHTIYRLLSCLLQIRFIPSILRHNLAKLSCLEHPRPHNSPAICANFQILHAHTDSLWLWHDDCL